MIRVLQSYDPEFNLWRQQDFLPTLVRLYRFSSAQSPSAVIGDFNGDKISDVALIGRNKSSAILLVLVSSGTAYTVNTLEKTSPAPEPQKEWYGMTGQGSAQREYGLHFSLSLASPGKHASHDEPRTLDLLTDAFVLSYFEKGSVMYYFKDGKFLEYTTAD